MNKIKFAVFAVIVCMGVAFTSCGKDDDNKNTATNGTEVPVEVSLFDGVWEGHPYAGNPTFLVRYTFSGDEVTKEEFSDGVTLSGGKRGTFTYYTTSVDVFSAEYTESFDGASWVALTWTSAESTIYSFSGDTLTLGSVVYTKQP